MSEFEQWKAQHYKPPSRAKRAWRFVRRWRYTILMSLVALLVLAWVGFLVWALHALVEWVTAQ